MTRKQRRSIFILAGMAVLGVAAFLILSALQDSIVFFYSPSDIEEKHVEPGQRVRVGGLVSEGTVKKDGTQVSFEVSDGAKSMKVSYNGLLPDLFREGQGVVVEGRVETPGTMVADTVLAKHDEKYMPPEVAESLKKRGVWRGGEASNTGSPGGPQKAAQ